MAWWKVRPHKRVFFELVDDRIVVRLADEEPTAVPEDRGIGIVELRGRAPKVVDVGGRRIKVVNLGGHRAKVFDLGKGTHQPLGMREREAHFIDVKDDRIELWDPAEGSKLPQSVRLPSLPIGEIPAPQDLAPAPRAKPVAGSNDRKAQQAWKETDELQDAVRQDIQRLRRLAE